MYFVDSQRTLTRRESSLLWSKQYGTGTYDDTDEDTYSHSAYHLTSISGASITARTKGSVEKEIEILLFESMLTSIVESWEVIKEPKKDLMNDGALKDRSFSKDQKKKKITSGGSGKKLNSKVNCIEYINIFTDNLI